MLKKKKCFQSYSDPFDRRSNFSDQSVWDVGFQRRRYYQA